LGCTPRFILPPPARFGPRPRVHPAAPARLGPRSRVHPARASQIRVHPKGSSCRASGHRHDGIITPRTRPLEPTGPKVMNTRPAGVRPRYAPCAPVNSAVMAAMLQQSDSAPVHSGPKSRSNLRLSPYVLASDPRTEGRPRPDPDPTERGGPNPRPREPPSLDEAQFPMLTQALRNPTFRSRMEFPWCRSP
jgi:hypothetical protein